MPGSPWDLYVFREAKRRIPGPQLVRELLASVERIGGGSGDAAISALIRAGEIESAASDHAPDRAQPAIAISDEAPRFLVEYHRWRAVLTRCAPRGSANE